MESIAGSVVRMSIDETPNPDDIKKVSFMDGIGSFFNFQAKPIDPQAEWEEFPWLKYLVE